MQLTISQIQELRAVSSELRSQPGINIAWPDRIDQCLSTDGLDEEDCQLVENTQAWNQHRVENRLRSVWQILEAPDLHQPHGFPGRWQVVYREHDGRSDEGQAEEIVAAVEGTTWLDLWRACEQAISQSGDSEHIVIRELRPDRRDSSKIVLLTAALRT